MLSTGLLMLGIGLVFAIFFKLNIKILVRFNPYLIAFFGFLLILVVVFLLPLFVSDPKLQMLVISIVTFLVTAFIGVLFQKYYFKLSDSFDDKLKNK